MLFLFILIGLTIFIFNKNWKNICKILMILFPFFGFISGNLEPYSNTRITSIFYDFIFVIPIYLTLFKLKLSEGFFGMMDNRLKISYFFLALIVFIQLFNPYNGLPIFAKLIGLKVWVFYILFITVGYYFIEKKEDVIKICKVISITSFVPLLIALLQYFLTLTLGYEKAMSLFYTPEMAKNITHNFGYFNISYTFEIFRIPSTFSFITQFANYILFIIVPALTSLYFSENKKEKIFFTILIFLILVVGIVCGARGMFIYLPIFFIYYWIISSQFFKVLIYFFSSIILIYLINSFHFFNLNIYIDYIYYLFNYYSGSVLRGGFDFFLENLLGNGTGTATPQVINITGESIRIGPNMDAGKIIDFQNYSESYIFKVINELGFFGVIAVCMVYINTAKMLINYLKEEKDRRYKIFTSALLAFYFMMITISFKGPMMDIFPSSFLIFFFIGMSLKLYNLNNNSLNHHQ